MKHLWNQFLLKTDGHDKVKLCVNLPLNDLPCLGRHCMMTRRSFFTRAEDVLSALLYNFFSCFIKMISCRSIVFIRLFTDICFNTSENALYKNVYGFIVLLYFKIISFRWFSVNYSCLLKFPTRVEVSKPTQQIQDILLITINEL